MLATAIIICRIIGLVAICALHLVYSFAFRFNSDFIFYAYFDLNYFLVWIVGWYCVSLLISRFLPFIHTNILIFFASPYLMPKYYFKT